MSDEAAITESTAPVERRSLFEIAQSASRNIAARDAWWSVSASAVGKGLPIVAGILVAREMGAQHYGEFGVIQSTLAVMQVVATFGAGTAATKFIAEHRANAPLRANRFLALSIATAVVTGVALTVALVLLAPVVSTRLLSAPHLAATLQIGSATLFLGAVFTEQLGVLAGLEVFKRIAVVQTISGAATLVTTVVGAWTSGIGGAVWGLVAGGLFATLFSTFEVRRACRVAAVSPDWSGMVSELPALWKFALPALLASLLVGPVNWFCSVLVANAPDGFRQLAFFNAATHWRALVLFLPVAVSASALPKFAKLAGKLSRSELRKSVRRYAVVVGGLAVLTAGALALMSPVVLGLYGPEFQGGHSIFLLMLLAGIPMSLANFVGQVIAAAGQMWHGFAFNVVWAAAMILLSAVLVPQGGALGLSWALVASYTLHTLLQVLYVLRAR